MNQSQYTTLLEVLAVIPDPRNARGRRYAWPLVLTLLAAGLASGQQTIRAMAQWVHLHADTLCAALPTLTTLPSESTLLRTARQIDVGILETAIAQRTQPHTDAEEAAGQVVTPGGTILQAQAVDGKTLRGTTACGHPTHLVSLVQHGSGTTLAHDHVAQKRTEITAVPHGLAGRDLTDTVVTMDARLTQRTRAQQSIDQGGHYLMMVQRNQPQLHDDTTGDCAALGWPGAAQLLRRTGERTVQKTGTCTVTVTDGITRVPPAEADAKLRERLWREHWTIESRSHYVRDVTLGEDRNHMRTGQAPQTLAALRNGLLAVWRRAGWTNIADAVRAHAASVPRVLALIGVPVTLT